MKLLFKQRFFSWLDSYDIYNEQGETVYTVEGKLSFGHRLEILDAVGRSVGTVKEEVFTFLPRFRMYRGGDYIGEIQKKFTFFKPVFTLSCNGWQVEGDILEWDYDVRDSGGGLIAHLSKELLHLTDTYVLDIADPQHALLVLMISLSIDAAKCSSNSE